MSEINQEAQYAKTNLTSKPYREKIEQLEAELHALSDELYDEKISIYQEIGYKPITIEKDTILVPVGISVEQLFTYLQDIPPDMDRQYLLTYFVKEKDRRKVPKYDSYQEIVDRRKYILGKIKHVYTNFWEEIVSEEADNQKQTIIYMIAGLEKDIEAETLSEICDVSYHKCTKFRYIDGDVVQKET